MEDLIRVFCQGSQVIHFAGHGETTGVLVANKDNTQSIVVSDENWHDLLDLADNVTVQCVMLNACYSADQAQVISRRGIYVVGHQGPVHDQDAIDFAAGFYIALGEGKNYHQAFKAGKLNLHRFPKEAAKYVLWRDGEKTE